MTETISAQGRNGQVTFDGKTVTITREGFAARLMHGRSEKAIMLRQITAVQFKQATPMLLGYIQFSVPGEISKNAIRGSGKNAAAKDENAVIFTNNVGDDFATLRTAIQSALADL